MATVRHTFESAKDDPADITLIGASEWNDSGAHEIEGVVPAVNVMDPEFGAVGDEVTDDSDALQAAMAAGKHVFFPPGDYMFSETLTVPTDSHWEGAAVTNPSVNSGGVVLRYTGSGVALLFSEVQRVKMENFQLHCQTAGATAMHFADPVAACVFENLPIVGPGTGSGTGLLMDGQTSCTCHNTFINCDWSGWNDVLRLSGYANNNEFVNCSAQVCTTAINLSKSGTDTTAGDDNLFERFSVGSGVTQGLKIADAAHRNTFVSLTFEDAAIAYSIAASCNNTAFVASLLGTANDDLSTSTGYLFCTDAGGESVVGGLRIGDVRFYRDAANRWKTDDDLYVGGNFSLIGDIKTPSGASSHCRVFTQDASNVSREAVSFSLNSATHGRIEFDEGRTVNIYAGADDALKTDDQFTAVDGLVGKYVAGAGKTNLADGDFTVTPANGATGVAHNTTDGKSYYCARANGTWKSVEVAA